MVDPGAYENLLPEFGGAPPARGADITACDLMQVADVYFQSPTSSTSITTRRPLLPRLTEPLGLLGPPRTYVTSCTPCRRLCSSMSRRGRRFCRDQRWCGAVDDWQSGASGKGVVCALEAAVIQQRRPNPARPVGCDEPAYSKHHSVPESQPSPLYVSIRDKPLHGELVHGTRTAELVSCAVLRLEGEYFADRFAAESTSSVGAGAIRGLRMVRKLRSTGIGVVRRCRNCHDRLLWTPKQP